MRRSRDRTFDHRKPWRSGVGDTKSGSRRDNGIRFTREAVMVNLVPPLIPGSWRMNDKGIFEPALFREAHKGPWVRVDRGGSSRCYRHHNTREPIRNSSYQRVGGMGRHPTPPARNGHRAEFLSRTGIDSGALDDMENRIPYVSMGRLFHECMLATSSPYFGMSVGQKISLSHLGVPGALMRHSATLRAGLQRVLVYQDLDNQRNVSVGG